MRYLAVFLLFLGLFFEAAGQISPPGLDDTRAVIWGAAGFSQEIGTRWQTTFYVGAARQSNPDNYSALARPAIAVANLEQGYRFNERWQLSGCISYRSQNLYDDDPMAQGELSSRSERRYYMRLYYRHNIRRVAFNWSFRPEYRTYYNHHNHWDPVPQELRFRFKVTASVPLNTSGSNQFIMANEWLTTTDHRVHVGERAHWTPYSFSEDRLTTYFRHVFKRPSLIVDAGLMYQLRPHEGVITHMACDLIFVNPFGKPASGE